MFFSNFSFSKGIQDNWTPEEDAKLLKVVQTLCFGDIRSDKDWNHICQYMCEPRRTNKQCRERWLNHVNPELRHDAWTLEEDRLVETLQRLVGNQWAKIARALPGRSDNAVKNRWNANKKYRGDPVRGIALLSAEELRDLGVTVVSSAASGAGGDIQLSGPATVEPTAKMKFDTPETVCSSGGGSSEHDSASASSSPRSASAPALDFRVAESTREFHKMNISVPALPPKPNSKLIPMALTLPEADEVEGNSLESSPLGRGGGVRGLAFPGGIGIGGDPLEPPPPNAFSGCVVHTRTTTNCSVESSLAGSVHGGDENLPQCVAGSPVAKHVAKYRKNNLHQRAGSDPIGVEALGSALAGLDAVETRMRRASDGGGAGGGGQYVRERSPEPGVEACLDDQLFSFSEFGALEEVVDNSFWEDSMEQEAPEGAAECSPARCSQRLSQLSNMFPDFFQLCSGSGEAPLGPQDHPHSVRYGRHAHCVGDDEEGWEEEEEDGVHHPLESDDLYDI